MITCHSEYGLLKRVFLKRADDTYLDDGLIDRDWQRLNYLSRPDKAKASVEYSNFESVVTKAGGSVSYFPKDSTVTIDSIYCRDASIATDGGMIICNMGKPLRATEPEVQAVAFQEAGMTILGTITAPGTVEGGDVAWLDAKTLAVGHTYRTNAAGIEQLKSLLSPLGVDVLVAPLPHYKGPTDVFHLMSILSPIDRDLAVVYSPLMPIPFRSELLARGFALIEVPEKEFDTMGCNVLATAPRQVMMVKGNPKTRRALETAGCKVHEFEGNEISVKGGGGPTCLTRPVQREI